MRKDFILTEEDLEFIESTGYEWESIISPQGNWVVIHNYPIPMGYTVSHASVALKIESGYPVSQIDMAYFYPQLLRSDNQQIGALVPMSIIDNIEWQRWSRHRTNTNPWRPGIDNLSTHMGLVNNWLEREFNK